MNYPVAKHGAASTSLKNWRISKKVREKLLQRPQALFGGDKLNVILMDIKN
ncbi:MAG: hypothetical protein J7L19_07475 [Dehalococcoidia bacterium]|nr:hypothetical protein [Dehalococcoidia bacterium]